MEIELAISAEQMMLRSVILKTGVEMIGQNNIWLKIRRKRWNVNTALTTSLRSSYTLNNFCIRYYNTGDVCAILARMK
jgi:hypothetical protein